MVNPAIYPDGKDLLMTGDVVGIPKGASEDDVTKLGCALSFSVGKEDGSWDGGNDG